MANRYSQKSGNWSDADLWDTAADGSGSSGVPANTDVVYIQAGHDVKLDVDLTTLANGLARVLITGGATPGMLYVSTTAGTYGLKLNTNGYIYGTTSTNRGRLLLAGGSWASPTALAYNVKCQIIMSNSGTHLKQEHLDVKAYATHPTTLYCTPYGTAKTVSAIATDTNRLTVTGHGLSANNKIRFRVTGGSLPACLSDKITYFVKSVVDANTITVAYRSSGQEVDFTDSGSGTLQLYTGHGAGTTLNVFEDVSAATEWDATADHDYCTIIGESPESSTRYGSISNTLASKTSSSLTFSSSVAAMDPGARIYITSRNVEFRTTNSNAVGVVDVTNAGGMTTNDSVYDCGFRHIGATTGYVANGPSSGNYSSGMTFAGISSNFLNGFNYIRLCTINGVHLFDTTSTANYALTSGRGNTVGATIMGVYYVTASNYGNYYTSDCHIAGCYQVFYAEWFSRFDGELICNYQTMNSPQAFTFNGLAANCSNLSFNNGRVSGRISGCAGPSNSGVVGYDAKLHGAVLIGNSADIGYPIDVSGFAAALLSTTTVYNSHYKYNTWFHALGVRAGIDIVDIKNSSETIMPGYIQAYHPGGYTKTAVYVEGTHGTPPETLAAVHETIFEDSRAYNWADIPFFLLADTEYTITVYEKVTTTSDWVTAPKAVLTDPHYHFLNASETLDESDSFSIADTDWHTITFAYTPTVDLSVFLRVIGKGGNTGGTGTGKLYWWATIEPPASGGGGETSHAF